MDGYVVDFLREEGRFAATVGDTAGAIHAHRHYLVLRPERPDFAKWHEEWEALRKELAALMRGATP